MGFVPLFVVLEKYMLLLLAGVGYEPEDGEREVVTMSRTALLIGLYFNYAVRSKLMFRNDSLTHVISNIRLK